MTIPLHITRKNIKHLYLRLDKNGDLQISAPKRMPETQILAFVEQKSAWIAEKQQQRKQQQVRNHNHLSLFGERYPITRIAHKRNHIAIENGNCLIHLNSDSKAVEEKLIIEYYRAQLRPILAAQVERYIPIIGATPAEIRTKNMKTKWGTCNTRAKRLWFNVQLARFGEKAIEYVVVHEMVHLLESSHNRRFYHLVERAMPDWKPYHDEMRRSV